MLLTYCYRNAYNIKVVILTFDAKTRNKRVNNPIRVFSCLVNKRLGLGNVGAVGGWVFVVDVTRGVTGTMEPGHSRL